MKRLDSTETYFLDKKLRNYFNDRTENVIPKRNMFSKIEEKINNKKEGEIFMKMNLVKKVLSVCTLTIVGITGVAIAAPRITSWSGHSAAEDAFDKFPTQKQVEEKIGYTPKYVEELPGGFKYKESTRGNSTAHDADGNTVVDVKELTIFYERENKNDESEFLASSAMELDEEIFKNQMTESLKNYDYEISEYNGISLYYEEMPYLFLPPDARPSEEELQQEKEGKLMISYGSSEVEHKLMQSISWYDSGIKYDILGSDTNLKHDEMVKMAQMIIDAE